VGELLHQAARPDSTKPSISAATTGSTSDSPKRATTCGRKAFWKILRNVGCSGASMVLMLRPNEMPRSKR